MSDGTHISWADATWSPVTGCTKVSDGCTHCYIERTPPFRMAGRRFDGDHIGATTGVQLHPERLDVPLHWRKPRRIFVCSLADLFHDDVPDGFITEVFARMWWSPQHVFQVLTKRHARMRSLMPSIEADLRQREGDLALVDCPTPLTWPLPNVWLGVSVENQQWANIRIPALLETPAAVRWISAEPLLGPVDLRPLVWPADHFRHMTDGRFYDDCWHCQRRRVKGGTGVGHLDWVVCGGESGPGARPMHPDWVRSLRSQCQTEGVAFHFKQWGEWRPLRGNECAVIGDVWPEGTDGAMCRRVGKKAAGRELDGQTWDEYPGGDR